MIIRITLPNGHATVNLQAVADSVGVKIKDLDRRGHTCYFVDYPIPRYRKLCKLILQYGGEEAIGKADAFLNKCSNKKAKEVWNDEKQRSALARR